MDFLKHKGGIIVAIICFVILALVVGFCLLDTRQNTMPEGTLVEWPSDCTEVII